MKRSWARLDEAGMEPVADAGVELEVVGGRAKACRLVVTPNEGDDALSETPFGNVGAAAVVDVAAASAGLGVGVLVFPSCFSSYLCSISGAGDVVGAVE